MKLAPGARALVPTGLILELAKGTEAQVRPRSGLALKHGVTVLNSPGTIDSDYRGELMVLLVNLGSDDFEIERGSRIAQLVIAPVMQARLKEKTTAKQTRRGAGGFGSTGVAAKPPGKRMANSARSKGPATKAGRPAKGATAMVKRKPTAKKGKAAAGKSAKVKT